ncbi:MAG TPA: hypothetical protein VJY41_03035, partial [Prolixibacteraceae bacterium]|nr:hypothetical protein [Prolixibacteraceae bacterium]
ATFNTNKGKLVAGNDNSPVFEIENKFVIAVVSNELEEGTQPFETVKSSIEMAVIKDKKQEMLLAEFVKAKASTIEETANNLNLEVESANGFNFSYGSVNAIGYEPSINGAASALEVNQLSSPITGRNGVYVIQLTNIEGSTNESIEDEKLALYQSSSYRASYQAYQTIKNKIKIVDKRSKFY